MSHEYKGSTPGLLATHNGQIITTITDPAVAAGAESRVDEKHVEHSAAPAGAEVAVPPVALTSDLEANVCTKFDDSDDFDYNAYPEGGLEAWLVVFGAWAAMVAGLGLINTIGPIQAYVVAHQLQGHEEAAVSWIFSIYVFVVFFCGLQIGPIFDAKGPRYLILAGSILVVLCMMLLSLCTEYWHFVLDFSLIGGLGSSLLFTPAIAAISHFFNKRRSTATGIATTGGAIGGILFPLTLESLIQQVGFAWATRTVGFIFLVLGIVANIFVKSRLPPKKGTRASSVLPDLSIFFDGTGAFALITAGTFAMEWGLFVPIAYLPSYCLTYGLDGAFSYQIVAILSAGSFFGRWGPGILADKIGRFNMMIAMLLLCMATVFGLWLPAAYSGGSLKVMIILYAVVFGFASGSNISLVPTCVGQLLEDASQYGRYYATCYTIVSFSTLTGIPIAGALVQLSGGNFWGLIVFTGLSYLLSTACFVAVRVRKVGWKLNAAY